METPHPFERVGNEVVKLSRPTQRLVGAGALFGFYEASLYIYKTYKSMRNKSLAQKGTINGQWVDVAFDYASQNPPLDVTSALEDQTPVKPEELNTK